MSKIYLFSLDTLKTISKGALGAFTFGIYHRSTTNKLIEINDDYHKIRDKLLLEKMKTQQYNEEILSLKDKVAILEKHILSLKS